MPKALIIGVSGQDGTYLAKSLLKKGYQVIGSSRAVSDNEFLNLKAEGVFGRIELLQLDPNSYSEVLEALRKTGPGEIYNLAGQSSVGLSFERPHETIESITRPVVNLLEAVRVLEGQIRFFSAVSVICADFTTI